MTKYTRKIGDVFMGVRWNLTHKEYELHEAFFRALYKKYFVNPQLKKLWWAIVVSWCNIIEIRYGNFDRDKFLDSLQRNCGTNFKDPGLEPGVLPES